MAASKALYANPPDWPHMIVWERRLRPGDLFIDVGANVGTYSVLCASVGAQVIAIEPAPDTAALLRENNELNGGTIEIIEAAVGSEAGTARFTMGQDTVNQLDTDGTEMVTVVTLDSLIGDRTVAGVKMDIEGGELDALSGATSALREHRIHLIQLERARAEDREPIARLLTDAGYEFFMPSENGDLIPTDSVTMDDDLFAAIPDHV
jgi:FkbM family methyltransferase